MAFLFRSFTNVVRHADRRGLWTFLTSKEKLIDYSKSVLRRSSSRYVSGSSWTNLEAQTINSATPDLLKKDKKASLVIFDKDGTLICSQSMWIPWSKKIASKIAMATGLSIEEKVYDVIGFCSKSNRVIPGPLAENTAAFVQDELTKMMVNEGISEKEAREIVHEVWEEGNVKDPETLKALSDLKTLFGILKTNNVKVAVCTSDNREGTEATLKELGIHSFVDHVVCGDDPNTEPKPAPDNAWSICEKLGVDPADTVMVGDTKADVGMGKAAKLGWNVGVLSGVGRTKDLFPDAHHVIRNVKDLLPLILPQEDWMNCYAYTSDERILVEPHTIGSSTERGKQPDPKAALVIFDLHGTLLCTHTRYSQWIGHFCTRLEQSTGLKIADQIHEELGLNRDTNKLQHGTISNGTDAHIKTTLIELIRQNGLFYEEAVVLVNQLWQECMTMTQADPVSLHEDLHGFLQKLKSSGVKIAICTGEMRETAIADLKQFGVLKYIDMMVCGDDHHSEEKSSGHKLICDELGVEPEETVIVGDSIGDLKMGAKANVKTKIGVLTGVGSKQELAPHADIIVPSVSHVLGQLIESGETNMKPEADYSVSAIKN